VGRRGPQELHHYWYNLSIESATSSQAEPKYPPFLAVYSQSQHVVVAVAPDEAIRRLVQVGTTVVEIEGRPVQEHVESQRGLHLSWLRRLRYDPTRKHFCQRELALPIEGNSLAVTLRDPTGAISEVQVPYAAEALDSTYP